MSGLMPSAGLKPASLTPGARADAGDHVTGLVMNRPGTHLAAGSGAGHVRIFDAASGEQAGEPAGLVGGVLTMAWSPDGTWLAFAGQDPHVYLWSRLTGEHMRLGGHDRWVDRLAWSPSGKELAVASGRQLHIWTPGDGSSREFEELPSAATGLAFSRNGKDLLVSAYGGLRIVPVHPGRPPRVLAWQGSLISMAPSPDGHVVACGSQDRSVHFWRLASGRDSEMRGFTYKPEALAWDADSTLLATAGDASICVWSFLGRGPEGTSPTVLEGHEGPCTALAFAPRQRMLASGGRDGRLILWNPTRSKSPGAIGEASSPVTAIAWGTAGTSLWTGHDEGWAIRWSLPGR